MLLDKNYQLKILLFLAFVSIISLYLHYQIFSKLIETNNKNNSKKYEIMKDKDEILEEGILLADIHADREFVSDVIRRMIRTRNEVINHFAGRGDCFRFDGRLTSFNTNIDDTIYCLSCIDVELMKMEVSHEK